jgi:hypothetical protein
MDNFPHSTGGLTSFYGPIIQFFGVSSLFGSFMSSNGGPSTFDRSSHLLLLAGLFEMGRRLLQWVSHRFKYGE